ncbi:MAG TPA: hypothetical protein ENK18_09110 [Deltaproteobacteria bacterium]|nr:hypothetical protein [Deltaproteobacteria bacterium]
MRGLSLVLLGLVATGCPKTQASDPVVDTTPRRVHAAADLVGASGVRATLSGELVRRTPPIEGATEGTAVLLDDGTAIFVSEGEPPEGWDWLIGTKIQIQGTLWEQAPEGWAVPFLLDPDVPMPAEAGMPLLTP